MSNTAILDKENITTAVVEEISPVETPAMSEVVNVSESQDLEITSINPEFVEGSQIKLASPILVESIQNWPNFELSNIQTDNPVGYLMVPIATLGTWEHEVYGEVSFTQADFDNLKNNFNRRMLGYEPPLFLGHATDVNSFGDRPAAAFLEALAQQEDVLWGFYAVVDEEVYMDVKKGKYRYSSAEIVRNAKNTESGEDIGIFLFACALTNTPFLTKMPRVKALANKLDCTQNYQAFAFPLVLGNCVKKSPTRADVLLSASTPIDVAQNQTPVVTTPINITPTPEIMSNPTAATEAPDAAPAPVIAEPAKAPVSNAVGEDDLALNPIVLLASNRALEAELNDIRTKFATLTESFNTLKASADEAAQAQRLATIENATISAAAKQAFSAVIKTPGITDTAANQILDEVVKMSAAEEQTYLTQQGSSAGQDEVVAEQLDEEKAQAQKQNFAYASFVARLQPQK